MSAQMTLFDFLSRDTQAAEQPKVDQLDYALVIEPAVEKKLKAKDILPTVPASDKKKRKVDPELLLRMKEYIKRGILNKSDEYYNVVPGAFEIVETGGMELSIHENELWRKDKKLENGTYYDLRFVINSDSYKLYKCYQENGKDTTAEDIYNLNMPQTVKDRFVNHMDTHGIDGAMDYFRIWSRPKYFSFARSTDPKELEKIAELVSEFAEYRQHLSFVEPYEKEFNFIRASRKKKSEDPACFDGNCLEKNILNGKISIFSREVD